MLLYVLYNNYYYIDMHIIYNNNKNCYRPVTAVAFYVQQCTAVIGHEKLLFSGAR
jgi:mRNA-degrading endonuclease HigB of HigAB toxin-antitoxin module